MKKILLITAMFMATSVWSEENGEVLGVYSPNDKYGYVICTGMGIYGEGFLSCAKEMALKGWTPLPLVMQGNQPRQPFYNLAIDN